MNDKLHLDGFDVSGEKLDLLEYLLAEEGIERSEVKRIQPRGDVRVIPLSFAQQRLWFLDQLVPGNAFYNISTAMRLRGSLNVAALERSFNEILRRHASLRTNFVAMDGQPVQVIIPAMTLPLPLIDLRRIPDSEKEARTLRLATEEAQRPFDLSCGPLLRVMLLRLGAEEHVLLLTMHHIVSDGWSMGVFFREVAALYDAFSSGKPSPLAELPIQYADFAHWQRQWLQGEVFEEQFSYWSRQLAGSSMLQLPHDRPRPAVQTFRGARQSIVLSPKLTEALKALSRREGATLFMTLLAAFQALLHRYTAQDDIVVGSPIANRNRAEIEGLIGFFVNSLVMRTDVSGNPTFRELLGRVREVTLGAYAHQDLPFERLVEELQPGRDMSQNPLFQVMIALQNAPMSDLELSGLTLNPLRFDSERTRFALEVHFWEKPDRLTGSFVYSIDLFEATTIARMMGHLQTLLESVATDPLQRISDLLLLADKERQQLLVEWNSTTADYPKDRPIHELFEAQVERTPETVAVVFEDRRLTYRELNRRSNQLAHHLQALGVKPETLIGICMERSLEMIVAILAILKAGGAYVPLDPSYPKDRLAFMLADAQAPVLLTQRRLADSVPEDGAKIVLIDADWPVIASRRRPTPWARRGPGIWPM